MKNKTARLRELISKEAVMMPGVSNAAMARQVEQVGFNAVYISGAGMANATAGVPDIGLLTLTEVTQLASYIANVVKIPAIVDADTGFGGAENVARTIQELEKAGLAGCHIEDQEFPKRCGHLAGKSIVDVDEMAGKIKAAVAARCDPDFLIVARTRAGWRISRVSSSGHRNISRRARMEFFPRHCKARRSFAISPRR